MAMAGGRQGYSGRAPSLGANDPRARRYERFRAHAPNLQEPLYYTNRGLIGLRPASTLGLVGELVDDLEDVEILTRQRESLRFIADSLLPFDNGIVVGERFGRTSADVMSCIWPVPADLHPESGVTLRLGVAPNGAEASRFISVDVMIQGLQSGLTTLLGGTGAFTQTFQIVNTPLPAADDERLVLDLVIGTDFPVAQFEVLAFQLDAVDATTDPTFAPRLHEVSIEYTTAGRLNLDGVLGEVIGTLNGLVTAFQSAKFLEE